MVNAALNKFLDDIKKEEPGKVAVFFIIPSGILKGIFKDYNDSIVTISDATLISATSTYLSLDMNFPVELIQAWGKK
jgi:hypothetical protein